MQTTKKSGQTAIMLLIITLLLITLTTAAVAIAITSSRDTTTFSLGENSLTVAETGAENAMLRLLRDPSYSGDANLPIGDGNATITVTGGSTKTILSQGKIGNMVRTVEVIVNIVSGQLTLISWREL